MATNLPTNIDATYADDGDPSRKLHQQYHDQLHGYTNTHDTATDPHGDRAYADGRFSRVVASATVTTSQSGITTEVDLTGLTVTFDAKAGRRYRLTLFSAAVTSTVNGDVMQLKITDGSNAREQAANVYCTTTGSHASLTHTRVFSGAVSHTWKVRMLRAAGSGSGGIVASSSLPTTLLVEDLGLAGA